MANIIDAVVGFFNPTAGLRRNAARHLLSEQKRAYEGASLRDGWRPRLAGASANADHSADARTLRARARSLVQNVPYITQAQRSLVANTVGAGIQPNFTGINAKKLGALWDEWGVNADADGRRDIYGLQAVAYQAMEQDGEVLIRLRWRRTEDGLAVPLQLQVLEIDWLDDLRQGRPPEGYGGPQDVIINGIQYNALGQVSGYWLHPRHPGEMLGLVATTQPSGFVPASLIIHLFNPQRPGQGRGITRLAPIIARARDLSLYEDAELHRKNLETRLAVLSSGDINLASDSKYAPPKKPGDNSLGALPSGGIVRLPDGSSTTVIEPKPAAGYVDSVQLSLHLIAAGYGVTFEQMTGIMTDVNFSSARVRLLDFRREVEQMQWLVLVPRLLRPICEAFVQACHLAGHIAQPRYSVDWSMPKWAYVNPVQDVVADMHEISAGLASPSDKLRQRGYKPDMVFAEIKSDFDKWKASGILDILMALQKSRPEVSAQPQDNTKPAAS